MTSVTEFLTYVRRRKAALRKELEELEAAERIYREAEADRPSSASSNPSWQAAVGRAMSEVVRAGRLSGPKTIKEMVVQLLDEEYPAGLTALEILDGIVKRWRPALDRTTLSPQLSRLKQLGSIRNDKTRWFLAVKETGAPDEPSVPA